MKILYDQQIFSFQEYGGISRYYYELIKEIKKTNKDVLVDGKYSNNVYLPKLKTGIKKFLPSVNFPYKNVVLFYLNIFLDSLNLKRGNFNLLHATYYHPYFLDKLNGKPYVITVHDLIHELFKNEVGGLNNKTIEYKKKVLINANHIIAVSENTKKDLIKLYKIPANKITVIYHGNSFDSVLPRKIEGLPGKYVLFVGNREGYKNFTFFVKAITPILKRDQNLSLVCAGGGNFSGQEKKLFLDLEISYQVKQMNFKSDGELAYIYKNALVYVLPSLYEGFGMTALEAFSMGCPVVASNTSSIPEVCGNAAVYVNPKKLKTISVGVSKILYNQSLRNELIKLGFEQSTRFTFRRTVRETVGVYKNILKS